jgi:predicted nucleic acid-binding protein
MVSGIIYYWDTCIFYAWLKDEKRADQGELEGIQHILELNKKKQNKIITSTITNSEILEGNLTKEQMDNFQSALLKGTFSTISVDIKISETARQIREYYYPTGKTVCTPDAIHLATAILYKVQVFHTFDERGDKDCRGLIPLNGNVAGHNLTIKKPHIGDFLPLLRP